MLCAVENEKLAIDTESGDDVRVLRLVTGLVDLTRVCNLVHDVALDGCDLAGLAVATDLTTVLIVVIWVWCYRLRNLYVCDLQEVGALI